MTTSYPSQPPTATEFPVLDVSVVVPVYNERESVAELVERLVRALADVGSFEILFVDDGSDDGTFAAIAEARRLEPRVRALRLRRNYGKSAALGAGFRHLRGARVVTIDGDLQDEPQAIPALLAKLDEGFDLVSGWKRDRQDRRTKRWSSRLFNRVTSVVSGLRLHDFNCGLKAYRRQVTDALEVYGELHRFLPALAHWAGFRVTEAPVEHHARPHGTSKFGRSRYLNGFLDLLAVKFLSASSRSPMHFFGRLGVASTAIGVLICLAFVLQWLGGAPMRVRPLMLFGVGMVILGVQFVSIGFLAELIAHERAHQSAPIAERLE